MLHKILNYTELRHHLKTSKLYTHTYEIWIFCGFFFETRFLWVTSLTVQELYLFGLHFNETKETHKYGMSIYFAPIFLT